MSCHSSAGVVFPTPASKIRRQGFWLVLLLACSAYAGAAPEPLPAELTLADALRATAERNPELRAQALDLQALQGRRAQAGVRPTPELDLELENLAGSGAASGTDALETTLALSQLIELGGKRELRVGVVEGELDATEVEHAIRRLDLLAEVARRFIRLVADQDQLALARRARELAERLQDAVALRVQAARSPLAEGSRASIALARARLEEARAERALRSSRYSLAATWGASEPEFKVARADLHRRPAVADFDSLVAQLADNPAITRYLSEQRLREAELRLARATRKPDLTLGAGVRRFEENGDHALVLSFSAPLPFSDRNRGAVQEARARLAQVDIKREAALVNARAELYAFYQQIEQARLDADTLQTQVIPQAEQALAQTNDGYERGRFSYLEVAEAQRELIELQRSIIEAAASYHLFLTEIERLTGQPLAAPAR